MTARKTAVLHRMVMDKHVCPYGLKSKYLLDHLRDAAHLTFDAFQAVEDCGSVLGHADPSKMALHTIGGYSMCATEDKQEPCAEIFPDAPS